MKRSNFVIGLGLSAVVHGALLYVILASSSPPPTPPSPQPAMPLQIASIDPAEKLPIEQETPPETEQQPMITTPETTEGELETPVPVPVPAPLPLERVVEPSQGAPQRLASLSEQADSVPDRPSAQPAEAASTPATPSAQRPRPEPARPATPIERVAAASEATQQFNEPPTTPVVDQARPRGRELEGTGDFTPPLRVHWRDASELVTVARTLGMRLAAVDSSGDIIGEVALTDPPRLKGWSGLPYGYSNRVRMLSPSIFSSRIGDEAGVQVTDIWVFVPSDRDRAMVEAQKEAVRRAGARFEDVTSVDGKFVRAANGSYRLDITNIRWRNPGSNRNG